jgi:ferredoxin-NADP reductase
MAGTALRRRLTWQPATVVDLVDETTSVRSIGLEVDDWPGHEAGQHLDVRLTAADGYRAQRSYSIASPPGSRRVVLTVQVVPDGEVSPYLARSLAVGDRIEVRGPIGGYFVWTPAMTAPLQLVAGGSGIVPLAAMLRQHAATGTRSPVRMLYSARSLADVIYRDELTALAAREDVDVRLALTRAAPPGWTGYGRRVDGPMVEEAVWPATQAPRVYVCGPTSFVETVADLLVDAGHDPGAIRTERFGSSGGTP